MGTYTYKLAILGGTFDHLHLGHKNFLKAAFSQSKHVIVGIVTTPTNKSYLENIETYELRRKNLESCLRELGSTSRARVVPINDIYGPSLTDPNIEAIFVTDATWANAEIVNQERKKRSMLELRIVIVPYALGDDQEIISSTRIRAGDIDRAGQSYMRWFESKASYHLPDNLRESLQHPLGEIIPDVTALAKVLPPHSDIISIGDIISLNLQKAGYSPAISIIDYKTRRHEIDAVTIKNFFPTIHQTIINPAGNINKKIAKRFRESLLAYNQSHATQVLAITGEEDLLALPAILLAPLDTYILYGIYDKGICVVKVTEEAKNRVKQLLNKF